VLLTIALGLAVSASAPAPSIRIEALVSETPDGPVRAWVARVDLTDPRVSFVVTGPLERREGDPESAEARLVPTDVWAERAGVNLAVNAGFFARLDGRGGPGQGWTDALPVDIEGLSRSEGRTVSPPRQAAGVCAPADPALLIDETKDGRCPCRVRVAPVGESDLEGVEDAVAGMGSRNGRPGTLLVENGRNLGATAQVAPTQRHPRTAAGVSHDGRELLLLVVDGRQPGWSIGATLPELAQMMLGAGAWHAINLDGGGSSALWHRDREATAGRVLNRPSDGRVRPVANHLGVRVRARP
jgi:exopolysaccharide biosynthesis protein